MADIRSFIQAHLLEPLKHYPTVIQDTMIELIIQKLQTLYDYTLEFPEILSPNTSRLDILKVIADQFLFTVREDADIEEQVAILDNILYVYSKRGSIDTIENMWKYYGGTLPKDVKVIIPSYKLFRYSVSKLSGTHVFQDNTVNRTGVYEVRLTNNTYPIPDLKEFMIKELVAAGNYIYFTNEIHSDISSSSEMSENYKYLVYPETLVHLQLDVLKVNQGFTWSGYNTLSKKSEDSAWSGRGAIFLELTKMINLQSDLDEYGNRSDSIYLADYNPDLLGFYLTTINVVGGIEIVESEDLRSSRTYALYKEWKVRYNHEILINSFMYCTPSNSTPYIANYLYNSQGNLIESNFPGYFILGESLLGEEVI